MGLIIDRPMTNRERAQHDPQFLIACRLAGVHPSKEQYRKFRWGRGRPFQAWESLRESEREALLKNETLVLTGERVSG